MQVLLVEDDNAIAEPLAEGLLREGFTVARVGTGAEACAAPTPDLVILDLGLPDMDGYAVCQQLRARSAVPILVVTARGAEVDKVVGLELGADDHIVKPFGFRELVARIRAVMRRVSGAPRPFYGTKYTKPLLFLDDGSYFASLAQAQHLTGSQWGVMNETGSYPGQPWLWLYTLWYQVRPFKNSANLDLMAIYLTGAATIILLALPFIPACGPSPAAYRSTGWSGATGTAPQKSGGGPPDAGPTHSDGPLTEVTEHAV
jgi:DNA-binding response OmpR family regulator